MKRRRLAWLVALKVLRLAEYLESTSCEVRSARVPGRQMKTEDNR